MLADKSKQDPVGDVVARAAGAPGAAPPVRVDVARDQRLAMGKRSDGDVVCKDERPRDPVIRFAGKGRA